tara:strand:- start:4914 stop:5867 length:954 start_codon:yes stop_codon:yes gene_type:complete
MTDNSNNSIPYINSTGFYDLNPAFGQISDDTDPSPPPFIDDNDNSNNLVITIPGLDVSGQSIPIDNSNIADTDSDNENIRIRPINNTVCCVCLTRHSQTAMVITPCKHDICNKCFFRWIKINPNCPYCRNNFTSWDNMADDDINEELYAVTHLFETVTIQHNKFLKKNNKLQKDNTKILIDNQNLINKNKNLFESNIRLNKLIDYSKGYYHSLIDGYKSHIISNYYNNNPFLVKLFLESDHSHLDQNKLGYQNGYNGGYKDFHQYVKSIKKKFKTCSSQTSLIHTDDEKDSSDEWSSRSQWSSLSPTSSSSSLDVDL